MLSGTGGRGIVEWVRGEHAFLSVVFSWQLQEAYQLTLLETPPRFNTPDSTVPPATPLAACQQPRWQRRWRAAGNPASQTALQEGR